MKTVSLLIDNHHKYKIEKNYSRMVSWEEAVGNSGGEKTVAFFAVISTLMAYSDERALSE